MRRIPSLAVVLLAAVLSTAPVSSSAVAQSPIDVRPTAADSETARDLMKALAVSLENYALDPSSTSAELAPVRTLLNRIPPGARQRLVAAAKRFSAQGDTELRKFYGNQYAASPQARLRNLPTLTRLLADRKPQVLRRGPLPGNAAPGVVRTSYLPQARFSAPTENHLRLQLQSIRVNSLNDDDTPDDEIYLGVWTVPGLPVLTRMPGSDYWRFRRGESRTLNVTLADFGAVQPGHAYAVFVQAFEYDDGTWGEIWSAFIQVAQFAADTWLQAEIGAIATAVVNAFLNELWDWIAGWFENADDFIDAKVLEFDFAQEPKFWAPGADGRPQVGFGEMRIFAGADASYRVTLQWTLSRQPKLR